MGKTWEGELATANLPGTMPELYAFTVWAEAVAAQLNGPMEKGGVVHSQEGGSG